MGISTHWVLAQFTSDVGALAIVVLAVIPMVAIIRTGYANKQIKLLGMEHSYGRQVSLAGAIITLLVCEIVSVFVLTDPEAPLEAWLLAAGLYAAYVGLIALALRPLRGRERHPVVVEPSPVEHCIEDR